MSKSVAVSLLVLVSGYGAAQVPYSTVPDWRSTDQHYATGGAVADLNNDGWPDLVVSNGNDMRSEKNGVFMNVGGTFATTPTWESNDLGKHGHLAVGDYDNDGWLDVAVTVLNPASGAPGVKVYRNVGGVLTPLPVWTSSNSFYGWHADWGDVDLDGDLDLLVGSSDAYGSGRWKNFIYFNNGGVLETTPSWQSVDTRNLDDMEFCDVDGDGDLDVVAAGSQTCNWVYRNTGGVLSSVPDWQSTDNTNQMANTLVVGDVTGDGRPDFVMSDNNQVGGGSGDFKLYRNNATGAFETTPGWRYHDGYVSGLALADVNNDGRLDLATGAWWGKTRIFLNTGTGFGNTPSWNSNPTQVVEAIAFGDINRDGLVLNAEWKDPYTGQTRPAPLAQAQSIRIGAVNRKLFKLDHQPIESAVQILVDSRVLARADYTVDLRRGYVTLKSAPTRTIRIDSVSSTKLDMFVTDWENNGNVVYLWK